MDDKACSDCMGLEIGCAPHEQLSVVTEMPHSQVFCCKGCGSYWLNTEQTWQKIGLDGEEATEWQPG